MKKLLILCWLLGSGLTALAQNSVQYTLRYNLALSRYEVYVKPNFTQSQYNWGSSQVSVVAPASLTDATFSVVPVAGGGWSDNSPTYNVSGSDFHGIGSNGAKVNLTSGQETLLFHFTLSNNACVPGLRLFVNGSDPNSSAPGMNGGDYTNTMYTAEDINGNTNVYISNYANTGTLCTACNLTAPTLSK
jgi:hypothetical protein